MRVICLLSLLSSVVIYAQDSTFQEISPSDSGLITPPVTAVSDTLEAASDTVAPPVSPAEPFTETMEMVVKPEMMVLGYGYKGFKWGSSPGTIPRLSFIDSVVYRDDHRIRLAGTLGPDPVEFTFFFADSGFWKVELRYALDQTDIDQQIALFSRIEKSLTEIYGPPRNMTQTIYGPSPSYSGQLDVNFTKAFYRSTWSVMPVRIELLLSSLVEHRRSDLPVFGEDLSLLTLIYYNPDFMYYTKPSDSARIQPSIFDIY